MVTSDLLLHPFRAQPYIQVKTPVLLSSANYSENFPTTAAVGEIAVKIRHEKSEYSSAVSIVERLFFLDVKKDEWILDDDQKTNWLSLGLPSPDYQLQNPSPSRFRQTYKDRQYMHRYLLICALKITFVSSES